MDALSTYLYTLDAVRAGKRKRSERGRELGVLSEPATVQLSYCLQRNQCSTLKYNLSCHARPLRFKSVAPVDTHEQKSTNRLGIQSSGDDKALAISSIPLAM
jgi:hypothetical protein